jgi:hypothetical protein
MGRLYTTLTTASGEVLKLPKQRGGYVSTGCGEAPLHAEVDVALPPGTPLRPRETALCERLGTARAAVTVQPRLVEAGADGSGLKLARCVQVPVDVLVEQAVVAEALSIALATARIA